jgi:hypothetical protein
VDEMSLKGVQSLIGANEIMRSMLFLVIKLIRRILTEKFKDQIYDFEGVTQALTEILGVYQPIQKKSKKKLRPVSYTKPVKEYYKWNTVSMFMTDEEVYKAYDKIDDIDLELGK